MSDLGQQLLFANVAFSAAILIVFLLRKPVRAGFGARLAYALWLLPPLAVVAGFLPPRIVEIAALASPSASTAFDLQDAFHNSAVSAPAAAPAVEPAFSLAFILALIWIAGAVAMAFWLSARQFHFEADMRRGKAGPAVVGFLRPRIVTPDDFEERFDPRERRVILAHETIHLRMHDARINGLAALLRCICWYNPLVHIAAHCLRIDQEMACDASVVARHPKARRLYADALLKAQLAARPLPLGCYWPPGAEHPLTERIEMLKQPAPGRIRNIAGLGVLTAVALSVGLVAWGVLPEERIVETIPYERPSANPAIAEQLPSQSARYLPAPGAGYDHNDHVVVRGVVKRTYWTGDGLTAVIEATAIVRNGHSQPVAPGASLWRADPGPWQDQRMTGGSAEPGAEIRIEGYVANDKRCAPECQLEWLRIHTDVEPAIAAPRKTTSLPVRTASAAPAPAAPASSPPATAQSPAPPANTQLPASQQLPGISINSDILGVDPVTGATAYTGHVELRIDDLLLKADALTVEKSDTSQPDGMVHITAGHFEPTSDSSGIWTGNVVLVINGLTLKTDRLTGGITGQPAAPVASPLQQPASYEEPQQTPNAPRDDAGNRTGDELAKRLGLLPGEKPGPAFASLFDADAPVYIRGKVTKVELGDPSSFIWVEGEKLYKVMIGRARLAPDFVKQPSFVGTDVRVRGYQAKDKTCAPECLVNGRDVTIELTPPPSPQVSPPLPPT